MLKMVAVTASTAMILDHSIDWKTDVIAIRKVHICRNWTTLNGDADITSHLHNDLLHSLSQSDGLEHAARDAPDACL